MHRFCVYPFKSKRAAQVGGVSSAPAVELTQSIEGDSLTKEVCERC